MLALRPTLWKRSGRQLPVTCPNARRRLIGSGCHRRRVPDRDCFEAILFRLVHRLQLGRRRPPRQRWGDDIATSTRRMARGRGLRGLVEEALHAYDRVIGLDLSEVAIDGSLHKAPCGGEGRDRAQSIGKLCRLRTYADLNAFSSR